MKRILLTILRLMALAIIYTVLLTVASSLTTPPEATKLFTPEQLGQAATALPIVSLIMSLMLSYLTLRSRWHGWKLAGALFIVFYVLYAFLGWVELLAFPAVSRQMPAAMLNGILLQGLIVGIPFSMLAVWILGKSRKEAAEDEASERLRFTRSEWAWRSIAGAILYVIVYFIFGYYVAWRTPGLPAFYGGVDPGTFFGQLGNVMRDTPWLFALAFFRGLIWVAVGAIIIRMHKGASWEVILATGVSFTVLMNAALVFPNPFFPPAVYRAHTIELVSSNFVYGLLLAAFMLWQPKASAQVREQKVAA